MADGLDSLTAMRTKATSRRTLPPPRHQPRQTPVEMPRAPGQPPDEIVAAPPATPPALRPPVDAGTELNKVSIYLDENTDAYLETVRNAGRATKPRTDATRSAVVRLALNRLAAQLAPADVVAELRRNAATHSGPGRKRG
jgi:hypothetical protein